MHKKSLIICFNLHQLEKALYLKSIINRPIEISCLSSIEKSFLTTASSKIITFKSLLELCKYKNSFEQFIFFSMVPTKELVKLLLALKQANRNVIAIQETHQLSTHNGVINNLILPIDSILAASDLEKEMFVDNGSHSAKKIFSLGWLFQKQYLSFVKDLHGQDMKSQQKIDILLIFSAPNTIALGSQESFTERIKIINFLQYKYPRQKIHLRLHPQEKFDDFSNFLKSYKKENIKIMSQNKSMYSLFKNTSTIVVSDKTQAALDLSMDNKALLIYSLGRKNFISEYLDKVIDSETTNGITFFFIKHPESIFINFHKTFFKSAENTRKRIDNFIGSNHHQDFDYKIEISLWKKVFRLKMTASERHALREYFDFNSNSWLGEINKNTSLKNVAALIGMQQIVRNNIIDQKNIAAIFDSLITPQVLATYTLEALSAYFYTRYKNLNINLHPAAKEILEAYRYKSNTAIKLLYAIEEKIYMSSDSIIRSFLYYCLISMTQIFQVIRGKS